MSFGYGGFGGCDCYGGYSGCGGYGYGSGGYMSGGYGGCGSGGGFALIVVLFILLIIVGTAFYC